MTRTNETVVSRVSVVLCNRNGGRYLGEAMHSILNQTFKDFELLVVENGSTDRSRQVEEKIAQEDSRVRIVDYEIRGLPQALNKGIDEAKGKYIARMDSDDVSAPTRIEKEVAAMETHPEVGMVHTGAWSMDARGRRIGLIRNARMRRLWPIEEGQLWTMLRWNYVISGTAMMKASILRAVRFDPKAVRAEDWDLWIRLATVSKFLRIDEPLYNYRIHSGQSMDFKHMLSLNIEICRNLSRWMKHRDFDSRQRRRLFGTMLIYWAATPYTMLRRLSGNFI